MSPVCLSVRTDIIVTMVVDVIEDVLDIVRYFLVSCDEGRYGPKV